MTHTKLTADAQSLFQGFSKLSRNQRFEKLLEMGAITQEDMTFLSQGGIKDTQLADKFIENSIGYFQLPLGVATHFRTDGRDYVLPMAVEETSIIASLSKTAKWVKQQGEVTTYVEGDCIIGQIQLAKVSNFENVKRIFLENKYFLIEAVNEDVASSMVKRGGGVIDLELKAQIRPDGQVMAIIHLLMNTCDAMGANIINQALEYLKGPIERLTGESVSMCILSNLNDRKLTTAIVRMDNIDAELGMRLQEASLFAETSPYRAATHNKGIMNAIDPILIATGNDWRAVEAAVHAYASRNGQYSAISQWRYEDGVLTGKLTAPIIVGIVGGVTSLHPTAKLCLNMMKIESANELSRVIAAAGLLQNLGAIKALCTDGIIKGHMKLHIDNLVLVAGASENETPLLKKRLQEWLDINDRISLNHAQALLAEIRHLKQVVV